MVSLLVDLGYGQSCEGDEEEDIPDGDISDSGLVPSTRVGGTFSDATVAIAQVYRVTTPVSALIS